MFYFCFVARAKAHLRYIKIVLGFIFVWFNFCRPCTQRYLGPSTCYKNVIYDIGTEILFLQSNDHNSTHIAPPELAFSIDYTKFCVQCCGTVKTRFKAFWDIFLNFCMRPWIRSLCFQSTFLPEGPTKCPKLMFHSVT